MKFQMTFAQAIAYRRALMRNTFTVVLFASLVAACGGGGSGKGDDVMIIDSGSGSGACTATTAGYGSPTGAMPFASRDKPTAPTNISGGALINADTAPDAIFLNLFKGFGTYSSGEITAKSVTLTGAETEGADCGACLEVDTDIDTSAGTQKDTYLASAGTLNITSVAPMLTFTITSAQFRHVDIVDQMTFQTKDSADGCTTSIQSMSFTATVEDDNSGSGSAARVVPGTKASAVRYRLTPVATY